MSSPDPKKQLFEGFARIGKALANGHRLELLEFLAQAERTVEALAGLTGLSVANASQHLQQLRRAGLVRTRKSGLHVHYRLADPAVADLMTALQRIAGHRLDEVERLLHSYLKVRDELEPMSRTDLLARARRGLVTVLDVRPTEEYAAGHVAGAINVPLPELEHHLKRLPRRQEVVAYCRGPYCVLAYEAVAQLRRRGFKARRLEEGYPQWRSAGLPVEESGGPAIRRRVRAAARRTASG